MLSANDRTVEIPESLYNRLNEKIKSSGFKTVSEYVVHCIREKLASDESGEPSPMNSEDEARIKDRLRALGYL